MRSREVIDRIEADGWYEVRQRGSHRHFRHPVKAGIVTVPHPKADLPIGTLNSIGRQAKLMLPWKVGTMTVTFYPAIVERGAEGFGVYFPDLPGCVSAGRTMQEAALGAEEALNGHLAVSADYGDELPEPSAIDAVGAEEGSEEVARLLVRGERPGRAVRVQVSIEEGLLARIDRVAHNRSRFLADAARAMLAGSAS